MLLTLIKGLTTDPGLRALKAGPLKRLRAKFQLCSSAYGGFGRACILPHLPLLSACTTRLPLATSHSTMLCTWCISYFICGVEVRKCQETRNPCTRPAPRQRTRTSCMRTPPIIWPNILVISETKKIRSNTTIRNTYAAIHTGWYALAMVWKTGISLVHGKRCS